VRVDDEERESVWAMARRGARVDAGWRVVTEEVARAFIDAGGFTHPLFTDPAVARERGFASTPVPNQALLLVMGGMVERTGLLVRGVRALTGYDEVAFPRRVCAGDTVHLEVELTGAEPGPEPGLGSVVARMVASVDGEVACVALARHVVETDPA
jgi:acyl dehydratase